MAELVRYAEPDVLVGAPVTIRRTALATLSTHRVVVVRSDGTLEYADNTNPQHIGRRFLLTVTSISEGTEADVVVSGVVEESTWTWPVGEVLYLGTNGHLTVTPPSSPAVFLVELARTVDADRIVFDPRQPVQLA